MFKGIARGDIKAVWVICTNPVATVPNRANVVAALEKAELVIAQDVFLDNETNRYADILLPGALWAEAEGVMINSERNMTLMRRAVRPPGEALPDWEIVARVACAMGYAHAFSYADAAEVFAELSRAWNPRTGYDIRGASHARLSVTPLQWPCRPMTGPTATPSATSTTAEPDAVRRAGRAGAASGLSDADGRARFHARPCLPPPEMPDEDYPFASTRAACRTSGTR